MKYIWCRDQWYINQLTLTLTESHQQTVNTWYWMVSTGPWSEFDNAIYFEYEQCDWENAALRDTGLLVRTRANPNPEMTWVKKIIDEFRKTVQTTLVQITQDTILPRLIIRFLQVEQKRRRVRGIRSLREQKFWMQQVCSCLGQCNLYKDLGLGVGMIVDHVIGNSPVIQMLLRTSRRVSSAVSGKCISI